MTKAFQPERADFRGISTSKPLFVSEAKQQTYVNVNEEGTEAAAVTMSVVTDGLGHKEEPPKRFSMIVDRPFCVAIVTKVEAVLFLGVVMDPR